MSWSTSPLKAGLIGALHGAAESAVLLAVSEKYTLSKDWFLAVMIVFANAGGFAIAARYGLGLIGVAVAGMAGMTVGGWLGVHLIGSYEYTVPTSPQEREMRIITRDGERVLPALWVPAERVKRIPVGGAVGVLLGWAAGAGAYAWLARRQDGAPDAEGEEGDG